MSTYIPSAADLKSAQAYDAMTHNPTHSVVRKSYQWLMRSILSQGIMLGTSNNPAGRPVTIEWFGGADDAYTDSAAMRADVRENGHLWTYSTGEGATDMPANHPMLVVPFGNALPSAFVDRPMNDVFRAVHDVFGHVHADSGFGPIGERRAWEMHRKTLPSGSWLALWCETRGQNTWTNAFGEHPSLPIAERPFGEQKSGIPSQYLTLI